MKKFAILFLDFDGVLNHLAYYEKRRRQRQRDPKSLYSLDDDCVHRLNDLLEQLPTFRVVVSSSWRCGRSIGELASILEVHGFKGKVIGKTIDLAVIKPTRLFRDRRALEIREWLRYRRAAKDDVHSFAIVDDDVVSGFGRRFVQTSFEEGGLTSAHVDRIIDVLGEPYRWRTP